MVSNSRRPSDTRRIRRLKPPQSVEVQAHGDGIPHRLRLSDAWRDLTLVRRPWRVDAHWWRSQPLSRTYYRIAAEDGPPLTVYRDLISGEWFRQEY